MLPDMPNRYEPAHYWEQRLSADFNLRGVGHIEYDQTYNRWLYAQKRFALNRALTARPPGTRALDVGSGVGWVIDYLLDRGFRVTGCDIADVAVDRLADRYPGAKFFKLAVGSEPIPREDNSYDVVTMIDVAYHIVDDAHWARALEEFARVLAPSGQIVITDGLTDASLREAEHVHKRSLADWQRGAEAAGLRVAKTGPLFRWLSRPKSVGHWRHLPDGVRGAVELALEYGSTTQPHMRWATLVHA
jgi:SAM-dependent methyltransferase